MEYILGLIFISLMIFIFVKSLDTDNSTYDWKNDPENKLKIQSSSNITNNKIKPYIYNSDILDMDGKFFEIQQLRHKYKTVDLQFTSRHNNEYKYYLTTVPWKEFRFYMYVLVGKKCQCCKIDLGMRFNLHHITYKRLGNEEITDVAILCPECHSDIHRYHESISGSKKINYFPLVPIEDIKDFKRRLIYHTGYVYVNENKTPVQF